MTEQPADGAAPARTRAQRRRQQSWFGRRRARKNARRREKRAPANSPVAVDEPETAVASATLPELVVDSEPEVALAPEPEAAPELELEEPADPAVVPVAGGGRRARRTAKSKAKAKSKSVAVPVLVDAPEPEPAPVAAVEPAPEAAPEPELEEPADPTALPVERGSRRTRRTAPPTSRSRSKSKSTPKAATKSKSTPTPTPKRESRAATSRARAVFWTRTMPVIAGVLVVLVGVGVVVRATDDASDSRRGAPRTPPKPTATTLLLVHHSPTTGNDLIALFGREGSEGSVLLIPGATQLDVPALGVATLGEMAVDDNGSRLTNSVENVVGVAVGHTVVLDDAGMTAVLGPASPFPVTLGGPVEILSPATKYPAGAQEVSAAQATQLLSGPQSVNELDRLVTASAALEGWLTRLKDPEVGRRTMELQADLGPLIATARAASHRTDTLPVDSIAIAGGERFEVREADLIRYVKRAFPKARLGSGNPRPRVEVLNGTGFLGVAQAVADKVVPAGGKITLTGNLPGFGEPTTQIVYYQDKWRGAAQGLLDAMGCGSLRKARKDIGTSDVTILVGLDCPQYGVPGGSP